MGDIENHRQVITTGLHHTEAEHVDHQVVVTEIGASLTEQKPVVPALAELVDNVPHLLGAQELGFLDVDHPPGGGHGLHQIRLSSQESGQLDDVSHLRRSGSLFWTVDIRDDGQSALIFHRLEDAQALP